MRISDWSSDVCSSDLGQPRLLVADQDREVLGHVAALHGVDADLFQSLGELLQLRRAVELAAIPETTGPGEDRRDRVRGRILALLVLAVVRSEEHTSELQSLMRISYAVFCLKKKKHNT